MFEFQIFNIQHSVLSLRYEHLIEYRVPNIYCVLLNHKNRPPLRKRHHNLWRHHNKIKVPRHDYVGGKTFLQWIWCNKLIVTIKSNVEQTILFVFVLRFHHAFVSLRLSKDTQLTSKHFMTYSFLRSISLIILFLRSWFSSTLMSQLVTISLAVEMALRTSSTDLIK